MNLGLSVVTSVTNASCVEGIAHIIRAYRILVSAHHSRGQPNVRETVRALPVAINICLPLGREAISDGQIALMSNMPRTCDVEPTFDAAVQHPGIQPLFQRWVDVFRANHHDCQTLTLFRYYNGTLSTAVLSAFTAARSGKGVFFPSTVTEFPVTYGTMDETSFSWLNIARTHRIRSKGNIISLLGKSGCSIVRSSAQICLWHDILNRDRNEECERNGSCEARFIPSPWKWVDPGQDSDSGEVRPSAAWPVISWSRACPKFMGLEVTGDLDEWFRRRSLGLQNPKTCCMRFPVNFAMEEVEWASVKQTVTWLAT